MKRGVAYCDKLPGRFEGKSWPTHDDVPSYNRFNVCSWSKQKIGAAPAFELSPMFLGPIMVWPEDTKMLVTNVENFWQASKVWPGEEMPGGDVPCLAWGKRRHHYWNDAFAHRHIKKATAGNPNVPLYSWWGERRLSYHEARVRMYIPMYAEYVQQTRAYKALEAKVCAGENVLLIGHDGYPAHTRDDMVELLARGHDKKQRSVPFGHELILCCLLNKTPVWEAWPGLETDDPWWRRWDPPPSDFAVPADAQQQRQAAQRRAKQTKPPAKRAKK